MLHSQEHENMNENTNDNTLPSSTAPTSTPVTAAPTTSLAPVMPRQAENDDMLIVLWLHGRSFATQQAYALDAKRLFTFVDNKPLLQITLADLQAFADDLAQAGLAPASQHRTLASVKSLFTFAVRLGYLQFDVGRVLRLPKLQNRLAERILDEQQVQKMIMFELHPRDRAILLLAYAAGLRVSEICGLKWRNLQPRTNGGQVTVHGKGGKTRAVVLPQTVWDALTPLREATSDNDPVFRSRKRCHLSRVQAMRIVRRAAKRAAVHRQVQVSPHWLRHAHASHALDRNAPIHVVQQTLGHASLTTTTRYAHARPTDSSSNYLSL